MKRKLKQSLNSAKRTKTNQSLEWDSYNLQSERSIVYSSQSERSIVYSSQSERSIVFSSQFERGGQSQELETFRSQSEWESDSGISSGRSSPVSGRVSPSVQVVDSAELSSDLSRTRTGPGSRVVSLDCEMVGTGPGGGVSEVARCSLVDYNGLVLLDEYVRPIGQITDYRSQWSGIRKHHLSQATTFTQARAQVESMLKDKVLVGHSVQVDLKSLDLVHPGHMIRDTSFSHHLRRLAGFPQEHRPSLKALTNRLLHRKIQVGRLGHCSVEDARAALDLYKLVEGEWEREVELSLRDERDPALPSYASSPHFFNDQYWSHAHL